MARRSCPRSCPTDRRPAERASDPLEVALELPLGRALRVGVTTTGVEHQPLPLSALDPVVNEHVTESLPQALVGMQRVGREADGAREAVAVGRKTPWQVVRRR